MILGTAFIGAALLLCVLYWSRPRRVENDKNNARQVSDGWDYEHLKGVLQDVRLPAMLVDMNELHYNVTRYCELAKAHGKTIRLATKSVRSPSLIAAIIEYGNGVVKGLMCFSAAEARFLADHHGHDDILLGYPIALSDMDDVWHVTMTLKRRIIVMVDSADQLAFMAEYVRKRLASHDDADIPKILVCLDVDSSFRPFGGVHIGVRRSPLRTVDQIQSVLRSINSDYFTLAGVMSYEAQIAGVPDSNPFDPLYLRAVIPAMQWLSHHDVAAKHMELWRAVKEYAPDAPLLFNVGGSGNLAQAAAHALVTEVTSGSGFLQSHLFDYFSANPNKCAMAFALRVTRKPSDSMVTCQSGGFTASGKPGVDKLPLPFLPRGMRLTGDEGCGEVQTPLHVPNGVRIEVGDPVLFRPAKAGEIAERFAEYILLKGGSVAGTALTYRGLGQTFY